MTYRAQRKTRYLGSLGDCDADNGRCYDDPVAPAPPVFQAPEVLVPTPVVVSLDPQREKSIQSLIQVGLSRTEAEPVVDRLVRGDDPKTIVASISLPAATPAAPTTEPGSASTLLLLTGILGVLAL